MPTSPPHLDPLAPAPAAAPTGSAAPHDCALLRVGQLAEQAGKTVRAIRFYEELGLLEPAQRTQGGFRQYDGTALVRIHWIDRLQDLGFSLTEIRDFLASLKAEETGPRAMEQLRTFYAAKLVETRAALERLRALEGELQDSLGYLSTCQTCAPHTHRSACRACGEADHGGRAAPPLVAAVQSPA
jgi:DNA-binding transcriptional MerR regulator